jgi:hypothetical protein
VAIAKNSDAPTFDAEPNIVVVEGTGGIAVGATSTTYGSTETVDDVHHTGSEPERDNTDVAGEEEAGSLKPPADTSTHLHYTNDEHHTASDEIEDYQTNDMDEEDEHANQKDNQNDLPPPLAADFSSEKGSEPSPAIQNVQVDLDVAPLEVRSDGSLPSSA